MEQRTIPTSQGQASIEELKDLLVDSMRQRGELSTLQCTVRETILKLIDGQKPSARPAVEGDTYLLCELMREFMQFSGFKSSANCLSIEAGIPKLPTNRAFLARSCGLSPDSLKPGVPLLLHLLAFGQQFGGVKAVVLEEDDAPRETERM
eukprot:gnl/Dysnectes_brevis/4372_a5843_937.p1 GENE.gnl/Dysnectes_brevis/4372_a5843_937~~gnl/Dysnectes_brevis/4372_a5843_937.p1  ORF type:complete len:160 (+),score=16.21 gnl/Dysnectes_brevis/4372_a5843_937:31-480(+)